MTEEEVRTWNEWKAKHLKAKIMRSFTKNIMQCLGSEACEVCATLRSGMAADQIMNIMIESIVIEMAADQIEMEWFERLRTLP